MRNGTRSSFLRKSACKPVPEQADHQPRSTTATRSHRLLTLFLTCGAAMVMLIPQAAARPGEKAVRLPVMYAQVSKGQDCTKSSPRKVTVLPWQQRPLTSIRSLTQGFGVTVAVVDTGVSSDASALAGRVTAVGSAARDCVGHGTFMAGIVAAGPTRGTQILGAAPQARILAVRGTDELGVATAASAATGIREATEAGVQIIVVSAALPRSSSELTAAVQDAEAHDILIVAPAVPDTAASPQGSSESQPLKAWPAVQAGVLSVLDVGQNGLRPQNAPQPVGADLAAPGDGVVGIGPHGSGHFIGTGSSFATAYVGGVAALVRSSHPDWSAAQTARCLVATAYPADVPRLDPYAALTLALPTDSKPAAAQDKSAVHLTFPPSQGPVLHRALLISGLGFSLGLLVIWAAVIVPRGQRRRWSPPEEDGMNAG
ncbi:S8 family serine peptidase (plasmid) [Streptomyces sp. AHU1]|uniref:S8 family serine peptidase n=1 Tax=Streptomyces sp. AHU1 TaxID=3377215 RepID=UPI003877C136